jgi:hypothetical protein
MPLVRQPDDDKIECSPQNRELPGGSSTPAKHLDEKVARLQLKSLKASDNVDEAQARFHWRAGPPVNGPYKAITTATEAVVVARPSPCAEANSASRSGEQRATTDRATPMSMKLLPGWEAEHSRARFESHLANGPMA